jgi:hypothetical protein
MRKRVFTTLTETEVRKMFTRQELFSLLSLGAFLFAFLTFVVFSAAEVKYLGTDDKTQGDWIGKYGEGGAIIFCNKASHGADLPVPYEPSEKEKLFKKGLIEEISITDTSGKAYGYIWNANPGDEKRCPWLVDKSARLGACVSGRTWVNLAISLKVDSSHYKVTIYCLDYDRVRVPGQKTYGYQGEKVPDKPDVEIGDHTNGVYVSWEVTGKEPFRYFADRIAGTVNVVVSGLFVDEMKSVEPGGKLSTTWGCIKKLL